MQLSANGCKRFLSFSMILSLRLAPEVSPSVTSGDLPGEGPGSPTYTETDKQ